MKKIVLAIMLLCTTVSFAQERKVKGNKNVVTKEKKVQKYNKVILGGGIDLMIMANSLQPVVNITADANLHQLFDISVADEILTIKLKPGFVIVDQTENFKVSITNKDLDKILVLGNSTVESMGILETNELEIEVIGNGVVKTQVKTEDLKITNKGNAEIKLSGKTNSAFIENNGNGVIDLSEVPSFFTEVYQYGYGVIYTNAINGLDGKLTGLGTIYYQNTEILNVEITGSGKLISK